jgi:hypothetical protein
MIGNFDTEVKITWIRFELSKRLAIYHFHLIFLLNWYVISLHVAKNNKYSLTMLTLLVLCPAPFSLTPSILYSADQSISLKYKSDHVTFHLKHSNVLHCS